MRVENGSKINKYLKLIFVFFHIYIQKIYIIYEKYELRICLKNGGKGVMIKYNKIQIHFKWMGFWVLGFIGK